MPTGTAEERTELAYEYFKHGIACPFLEDESCSIHPDRPMACREYLVSSPAENCRAPRRRQHRRSWRWRPIPLPALVEVEAGGWVALILRTALSRRNRRARAVSREAPAILREVIGRLVMEEVVNPRR